MWASALVNINRNKVDIFGKRYIAWGSGFLYLYLFESMDSGFNLDAILGFQLYRYSCYISVGPQRL